MQAVNFLTNLNYVIFNPLTNLKKLFKQKIVIFKFIYIFNFYLSNFTFELCICSSDFHFEIRNFDPVNMRPNEQCDFSSYESKKINATMKEMLLQIKSK